MYLINLLAVVVKFCKYFVFFTIVAFAYYTTDTADWDGKNYKWIKSSAQVSETEKTIVAEIPQEALYYFVNGTDANGIMYSSPMKRVLKKK